MAYRAIVNIINSTCGFSYSNKSKCLLWKRSRWKREKGAQIDVGWSYLCWNYDQTNQTWNINKSHKDVSCPSLTDATKWVIFSQQKSTGVTNNINNSFFLFKCPSKIWQLKTPVQINHVCAGALKNSSVVVLFPLHMPIIFYTGLCACVCKG